MHKRKIKMIMVITIMIATAMISGCKGKNKDTKGKDESKEEKVVEDNENKEDKEDTKSNKKNSYEPTQEILDAKLEDGKIQIKDKVYTLPIDFAEFEKIEGFEITDVRYESKDTLFGEEETETMDALNVSIDGKKIELQLLNKDYEQETFKLENAKVVGVGIFEKDLSKVEDNDFIYYMGGATIGENKEEVLKKIGVSENELSNERVCCKTTVTDDLFMSAFSVFFTANDLSGGILIDRMQALEPNSIENMSDEEKEKAKRDVEEYAKTIKEAMEKIGKSSK